MSDVTVTVSANWVRRINSPLYFVVATLTGVSMSFAPLFLYELGKRQVPYSDARVILCFAMVVLVGLFYIKLGHHVIQQIRK